MLRAIITTQRHTPSIRGTNKSRIMDKQLELLAPAGNMECLDYALMYGADAVYLAGTSFGMRAGASNFTADELSTAVRKAHTQNVKVYLTCNIVAHNKEINNLPQFMQTAADAGVDAFIISDLGVMSLALRYAPSVPVHISTQTGVANYETANMLYSLGASRVVLARELPFDEITELRAKTPKKLEIEAFVHGSMCVSFSGRCLLSSYMTGRDANRGDCAQPCRWKYALVEEKREGQYFPIFEDGGAHILNSRDMCMIEHIPLLDKAGITSLKIEGRAKSSYYVAVTTNAYRCAIDEYLSNNGEDFTLSPWIAEEVNKVSHREYSTGFYFGGEPGQVIENGGYVRSYEVAAVVTGFEEGMLIVSQRNKFSVGDELELLCPKMQPEVLRVSELFDADGQAIENAPHPMMTVKIPYDKPLPIGSVIRRKK